ncbi:MAG: CFI-box-CTERM domain-containing protein, partial [Pseudobdellovibrionaceae bacterium]
QLWKGRVKLVKQGRMYMSQKMFSEAAISYEKYIKVLELVFDIKKGNLLTPEIFKESARTSELTVVASTYWDLLRIYDTSSKYRERQAAAAKQLAIFLRFTPIFPDILNRAQSFAKQAKNPDIIKQFLKMSAAERPRCFIATSAYLSAEAYEVQILRHFRDHFLRHYSVGRWLIYYYYQYSPRIACYLDKKPILKKPVRAVLNIFIKLFFWMR